MIPEVAAGIVPAATRPAAATRARTGGPAGPRRVLGLFLGVLVRLWVFTLRVTQEGSVEGGGARRVFAFLHGQQMSLLAVRRVRRTAVLVSRSADGELQSGVMQALGLRVVRGSSSRGGARGLAALVKLVRGGQNAAFAVDGPRGPAGVPKPGAALAARATGAELVPVASAIRRGRVLGRAWDTFEIPLPFSRVAVVIGEPVDARAAAADPGLLGGALARARERAARLVRTPHAESVGGPASAAPWPGAPARKDARA